MMSLSRLSFALTGSFLLDELGQIIRTSGRGLTAFALLLLVFAGQATAQQPALPPGHPVGGQPALPPGHPVGGQPALPPGHPVGGQPALPPGHPPAAAEGDARPLPPGHPQLGNSNAPADATEGDVRSLLSRTLAHTEESSSVPAGSIRIEVVDGRGQPAPSTTVMLGIMAKQDARERRPAVTGADGSYTYQGLAVGDGQAYRVSAIHNGATYGAMPFRLSPQRGYLVKITRPDTSQDSKGVFVFSGQAFVELREKRVHVVLQMKVANVGQTTYVFPADGMRIALPKGFTAFQTQETMGDQKVTEVSGEGVKLTGSVPPGQVDMVWAYDLPIDGESLSFETKIPFRTFMFAVMSQAPPGLGLEVEGFPSAKVTQADNGEPILFAGVRKGPEDPPLLGARVTLTGIPGPGPFRYIALGGSLLVAVLLGLFGLAKASRPETRSATSRDSILAKVREVEAAFARGEIGPQFRQTELEALTTELAVLLRSEKQA